MPVVRPVFLFLCVFLPVATADLSGIVCMGRNVQL